MESNSTEREYLMKSRNLTWEYVEVFEDQFGPVKQNDGIEKNIKDHASFADTGAKCKGKTSGSLHVAKNGIFPKKNLSETVNEEEFGGTHVHIKPSLVLNVQVMLSNADIDEQYINSDDSDEVLSQSLVPPQIMFDSNDKKTSSAQYHCSICQKQFLHKALLTIHLRTHTGEKPFSCPQCEKTFTQKGNLKRHLLVHSGTKEYSCDICYKAFAQKENLKRHLLVHSGTKEYSCEICNKAFALKETLKAHLLTHSGTKKFSCDICYKSLSSKQYLKAHLLVHSGAKEYSCDICYKTFPHHQNLKTHRRIHTRDKPYECKGCDAMFAHNLSLQKHMLTHNG